MTVDSSSRHPSVGLSDWGTGVGAESLWVGDVGDFTGSAVLGRDERFSGCAAASSYKSLT